jgi:hypothetical protein
MAHEGHAQETEVVVYSEENQRKGPRDIDNVSWVVGFFFTSFFVFS